MAGIGKKEPSEYEIQKAVIDYWRVLSRKIKVPEWLLFHIPNEGTKNPVRGKMLKAVGVRAGVPDLFLAYPCNGCNGLFLELKHKGGKVSIYQKIFLKEAEARGYMARVAWDVNEACEILHRYLQ